jgi:hypothetical protein
VADSQEKAPVASNGSNGSMGLIGIWRQLANLTAVVLMMGLFVWLLVRQDYQAREDRQLCREQITAIHVALDRLTDELRRR